MRLVRSIITLGALVALQLPQLMGSVPHFEEPPRFNSHIYGGFREDFLKFHIGGEQPHSKNFSKVEWKNLKIAQIGGHVDYSTYHHYYMRLRGDYGRIFEGTGTVRNKFLVHQLCREDHDKLQPIDPSIPQEYHPKGLKQKKKRHHRHRHDHDHHHDHHHHDHDMRPLHFHKVHEDSKQTGHTDSGHMCDLTGGIGWKVISDGGRGWIAGLLGYSYETQSVTLKNFKQNRDSLNVMGNSLKGLHGSYSTRWVGPFIGIDLSTQVECNVTVFGTAEWHILNYRGKGRWSFGDDYTARFRHHARGWGAVGWLGFDWAPNDQWAFGLLANYEQWSTRRGQNRAKVNSQLSDQSFLPFSFPVARKSHLYRVKWISWSLSFQASYRI